MKPQDEEDTEEGGFGVNVSLLDQASSEVHMTSEILSYVKPSKKRKH